MNAAKGGETLLKPAILVRVLAHHASRTPKPASASQTDSTLTERELEVLQAAARSERNKEIAYKLGITKRTVKAHLQSIYQKYGVDSRAAAVAGVIRMNQKAAVMPPVSFVLYHCVNTQWAILSFPDQPDLDACRLLFCFS